MDRRRRLLLTNNYGKKAASGGVVTTPFLGLYAHGFFGNASFGILGLFAKGIGL